MKTHNSFVLSAVIVLQLAGFDISAGETLRLASETDRTNVAAAGSSLTPGFSADGRFLTYVSHANNLVTNDDLAPYLDVFVRDRITSNTILVSVNLTGVGGGNADATAPSISSNGQFVAFASVADNLVNNDTNGAADIFLRDLVSGVTTLISVDRTGTGSAGNLSPGTNYRLSSNPLISRDGRWIVFESLATNLVALTDTNQMTDVFVRDRQLNTTVLVSVNAAGTGSGNGDSESPEITPDGRFVAFVSTSTDLVSGPTNQLGDIYVRDLQSGTTVWASMNVAAYFTNSYRCFDAVLSADGRFAAFKANSPSDAASVLVIHHYLQTGISTVLTNNSSLASWPEMSADGRFIASESATDVYVWDVQTGSNVLVSVNASGSGPGNQASVSPVMTPDGRSIVFLSRATDLAPNATNGLSQVFVRDLAAGTTRLVSANVDGLASSSDIEVSRPAITADGRRVLFETSAPDLVFNDLNQSSDIFLRDLDSATTELVSQRHPSLPAITGAAINTMAINCLGADGRLVLFTSFDNNFLPGDTNQLADAYLRDLSNGTTVLASADDSGAVFANQAVLQPLLSADGKFAAFLAKTNSLEVLGGQRNLFRRDLQSGITTLVNVNTNGWNLSGTVTNGAISADGRLVAFQSDQGSQNNYSGLDLYLRDMETGAIQWVNSNSFHEVGWVDSGTIPLFSPDNRWLAFASRGAYVTTNSLSGGLLGLYTRDLFSNTTTLVSIDPAGKPQWGYTKGAVFSADSHWMGFVSSNLSVTLFDLRTGTSTVVCAGCDNPSLSADGRLVAYQTPAGTAGPTNIVVLDRQTGATNLISVNRLGTGGGDGNSQSPLLSWDGRFVVFESKASDLVDNDSNNASDIFVRDRVFGTTLLVSLNMHGTASGNSVSSRPSLAADGRTVVFQSLASDLVPGDYNDRRDVFVLRLGGPDTDGDGMDDDWEMAYFGTLARDGTGDFDGDGHTDLQEFLAGTDPTNSGSILRVMTLTPLGGGGTRVIWSASPGKRYRVQFKDNIETTAWTYLADPVLASGTTASLLDNSAGQGNYRFYRVALVP